MFELRACKPRSTVGRQDALDRRAETLVRLCRIDTSLAAEFAGAFAVASTFLLFTAATVADVGLRAVGVVNTLIATFGPARPCQSNNHKKTH